ncbi:MAG: hypothetical protein ACFFEO_08430 [Candidatus Thorarchaeota archaeon]
MKYYKVLFVGLVIFSIIFLVLSLILGEFFIFFPFFFFLPLSCGIRRRVEETIDVTSNYSGDMEDHEDEQENLVKMTKSDEKRCVFCNKIILEQNLRFCPHCGKKIKT